jgi:ribonuclease Y
VSATPAEREVTVSVLETFLAIAVILLAGVVGVGFFVVVRFMRQVGIVGGTPVDQAKTRNGKRPVRAPKAEAGLDDARTALSAARSDAAAARAEAGAARSEARRILDSARSEADGILERAHRQADSDSEQTRVSARRAGEREVATLTAVAKEQAADAERRQLRLDDRERLLAEEADRVAERNRRISATEAELAEREASLVSRESELASVAEAHRRELERVAGLTADTARAELIESIEGQAKRDAAILVRDIEADARATADTRARHVVVEAIQRVASEQTA